ncbi:MAG: hypothetical protein IPM07_30710 [Anaerolineales bacterium]|nr:hypothetical protein [Anaerolineales bacterium]
MTQPVTSVTLVTRDATLDDLSTQDYRDIYDELREKDDCNGSYAVSLDKFVTLVLSQYSKAQWSKYHNGETTLTRAMRNELRRCVGLKPLPPTVAEATATASPDAAVWQVGDGPADSVILVTGTEPIMLHVNGAVSVADYTAGMPRNTGYNGQGATKRHEAYRTRPTATKAQDARRSALGVKWAEVIERGLKALEQERAE